MFTRDNEFPAPEAIGLRLSDTARIFYGHSEPFYFRFLPYWMADVIAGAIAVLVAEWGGAPAGRPAKRQRAFHGLALTS
ncbi:MAG: hypothetical protein J2P53_14175 [Bradyrhizobiaceae bacterium]|nr:hypothetical protein [Bradyrhizobiaceae bacterium]